MLSNITRLITPQQSKPLAAAREDIGPSPQVPENLSSIATINPFTNARLPEWSKGQTPLSQRMMNNLVNYDDKDQNQKPIDNKLIEFTKNNIPQLTPTNANSTTAKPIDSKNK